MNVVQADFGNLQDIPAMLEAMAEAIRAGRCGAVISAAAVFLDEDGNPYVCGWGRTDDVHSIGILNIGAAWLASHKVER